MMGLSQSNPSGSDANESSLLEINGTYINTQISVISMNSSQGSSFCQQSIMKEIAQGESNRTDGGVVFQAANCGHALVDTSPELRQETQGIVDVPRDLSSSISSDFAQMFSLLQSIFKISLCIYKKILLFLPPLIRSKLDRTVVGVLLLAFFLGFKEILELPINFTGWKRVQGLIFGKISYLIKEKEPVKILVTVVCTLGVGGVFFVSILLCLWAMDC